MAELSNRTSGFGAPYGITNSLTDPNRLDWDFVKRFENHERDGIAYPEPDMSHSNFWGAINHAEQEGFFRVADNTLTPGLKVFTFGHDNTVGVDPRGETNNRLNWERPMLELWAGTSSQFFRDTTIDANSFYDIKETYSPSVGLVTVTHASEDVLAHLTGTSLGFYFMTPDQDYRVVVIQGETELFSQVVTPDAVNGNRITGIFPVGARVQVVDALDEIVLDATL